jgi:acyl carrier protein
MKREEIYEVLKGLIKTTFRDEVSLDNVTPDTDLVEEIGINSIVGLEVLVRSESEFGITIEDEDLSIELMRTLSTLADYIEKKMQENG